MVTAFEHVAFQISRRIVLHDFRFGCPFAVAREHHGKIFVREFADDTAVVQVVFAIFFGEFCAVYGRDKVRRRPEYLKFDAVAEVQNVTDLQALVRNIFRESCLESVFVKRRRVNKAVVVNCGDGNFFQIREFREFLFIRIDKHFRAADMVAVRVRDDELVDFGYGKFFQSANKFGVLIGFGGVD